MESNRLQIEEEQRDQKINPLLKAFVTGISFWPQTHFSQLCFLLKELFKDSTTVSIKAQDYFSKTLTDEEIKYLYSIMINLHQKGKVDPKDLHDIWYAKERINSLWTAYRDGEGKLILAILNSLNVNEPTNLKEDEDPLVEIACSAKSRSLTTSVIFLNHQDLETYKKIGEILVQIIESNDGRRLSLKYKEAILNGNKEIIKACLESIKLLLTEKLKSGLNVQIIDVSKIIEVLDIR